VVSETARNRRLKKVRLPFFSRDESPPVSFSLRPYFWYGLLALLSLLLNAHVHRVRGWRNFAVLTFHNGANLSTGPEPVLGVRKPVIAVPLWILDYNSLQGPTPTQNSKGPLVQ
jgi:hypothetical protein